MLSATLDPVDCHPVGSHPIVVKLLKGCCNRNPPKAKYDSTWDPMLVYSYTRALGPNESLSLYNCSAKLATILALASLLRVGELASIDTSSIQMTSSLASFSLLKPRKAQHAGSLKRLRLASEQDSTLCPVGLSKALPFPH